MVGPKRVISCEDLFQAVDVAFKLFYILNLKFPRATFVVWSFIQIVVYKLTASHVPPQVASFVAKMNALSENE